MKRLLIVLFALGTTPSIAHEMRHLGGNEGKGAKVFMLHVGFTNEPAYEDVVNGIDFNVSYHPDEAHDSALTEPVDTAVGDTVRIEEVEVFLLNNDASKVVKKRSLPIPVDNEGNLKKKFGTKNQYVIYFRPTMDGSYGFRLKGFLKHNESQIAFDETFICGTGSKDRDSATGEVLSKFNCVEDPVAFPGPKSLKRKDINSYKDNDGF